MRFALEGECREAGCGRSRKARGWCTAHYARWRKYGDPQGARRVLSCCTVPDCGRPHRARGYCDAHYQRWRVKGDPSVSEPVAYRTRGVEGSLTKHGYVRLFRPGHPNAGVRGHDNRIKNLELWVKAHGAGQRVEDRVEDALWVLRTYRPDALASAHQGEA